MGKTTGFIEYDRVKVGYRPVDERTEDFQPVDVPLSKDVLIEQAARCMDCGIPFCHGNGCPLGNQIPEFNDLVYRGQWRQACMVLHETNNFPEFTGRVCPSPCEASCTLALEGSPVNIYHIEQQIAETAWENNWIVPVRPTHRTGKKVAVIGSGPAGLAAAQQLNRAGHEVVLFEQDDRLGGLLRYGIPDFKLGKSVIDRRVEQLSAEGIRFEVSTTVGEDVSVEELHEKFDAIVLTIGAGLPRLLDCNGAGLDGVYPAMTFLAQQNRRVAGDPEAIAASRAGKTISAEGKNVVVIGGGDTGSDCVGTSIRQGAASVTQIEIMPKPPEDSNPDTPWPLWPQVLRTSSSQQEGCQRDWSILTRSLAGDGGRINKLHACRVDWAQDDDGRWKMAEVPGSEFTLDADLVLLSMGFVHPVHDGLVTDLGVELDPRGNVKTDDAGCSSVDGVFAAGDAASGASLVVRAIASGRQVAAQVDAWLSK